LSSISEYVRNSSTNICIYGSYIHTYLTNKYKSGKKYYSGSYKSIETLSFVRSVEDEIFFSVRPFPGSESLIRNTQNAACSRNHAVHMITVTSI